MLPNVASPRPTVTEESFKLMQFLESLGNPGGSTERCHQKKQISPKKLQFFQTRLQLGVREEFVE